MRLLLLCGMSSSGSKRCQGWWDGRDPATKEAKAEVLCFCRYAAGDAGEAGCQKSIFPKSRAGQRGS
ncbi:hypothetical protein BHM03_00062381 [Ensete ventricosum]|nr:hypothetical protein BHM03_00062381 [Ensete ventricosum]